MGVNYLSDNSGKDDNNNSKDEQVKQRQYKFLKWWIIGVILLFLLLGSYMVTVGYENKQSTINRHIERMSSNHTETGLTAEDFKLPANSSPTPVITGIYVDGIRDLSLSDSIWTADFYIWFKWNGSDVNPGENFQVIDGEIGDGKKQLVDEYTNGTEHYQVYYVTAKITKFFDVLRFPIDSHILTIEIEDKKTERGGLIYVEDNNASNINSKVQIHGYRIDKLSVVEKPHIYQSNFGDPRITQGPTSYSQFRVGIEISRPDMGFYLRIFIGLFVAVIASFLALLIKPCDAEPRFGLQAGGLFVAIANTIITSELIPKTGIMTLADMINDFGLIIILVAILESIISLYLYRTRGKKELPRIKIFDRISFVLLLVIYIIINTLIVVSAR
jgi:hypothetical protein